MAGFFQSLISKFKGRPLNFDEIEESLLRADLGVPLTLEIMETLRKSPTQGGAAEFLAAARELISQKIPTPITLPAPTNQNPIVLLIVGVNGTGKTTSSAKLAAHLLHQGRRVLLVAADTFRAAAIEQIQSWGQRLGIEVFTSHYGADPSALCYDAWTRARKSHADYLICDTAGRLHTKDNLMKELSKISRTLAKHDPSAPHEKLLVVDATTGSNAVTQAKEFHSAIGLTGIILTKLDGSGKGGVIAAIAAELGIPTRFVGTGEAIHELEIFDPKRFVSEML